MHVMIVTVSLLLGMSAWGQTQAAGTQVAVVSIPVASEEYEKTHDLEAKFDGIRQRLGQERDALRDKIERLGRSLQEELKPGTEAFRLRRKELALQEAELQWFVETERQRVELGLAESLGEIYRDIQNAVREVAEARGIDIVLASDQLPEDAPESSTQLRQQILLQKVVYWNPRVDITDAVVERLNKDYNARRKQDSNDAGAAARRGGE